MKYVINEYLGSAVDVIVTDNRPRFDTFTQAKQELSNILKEIRAEIKSRYGRDATMRTDKSLSALKASAIDHNIRVYMNGHVYYTTLSISTEK